ncbi:MAG: tetratricopeptide repeat protein [Candidatus Rokubacteria bacterium]|nr:tetratricopeptide repeat protein [Candidatus Rokubacteria bacterium]
MRKAPVVLALLLAAVSAPAQSPIEEARAALATYHEDVTRLDRARDGLEKFLKTDSRVEGMILLSRIYFQWGDVRASDDSERLAAYDRGRELGKRAVELGPKSPEAHFWYAVNTAKWGQTKGAIRSLFLLPTLREEIDIILTLAPEHPGALQLAGSVELGLPWGDLDKAEADFRKGLKIDPHYTSARVDLARLLIKRGKYPEARRELQRVLNEKEPRFLADWTVKHTKRARELLDAIKDKS